MTNPNQTRRYTVPPLVQKPSQTGANSMEFWKWLNEADEQQLQALEKWIAASYSQEHDVAVVPHATMEAIGDQQHVIQVFLQHLHHLVHGNPTPSTATIATTASDTIDLTNEEAFPALGSSSSKAKSENALSKPKRRITTTLVSGTTTTQMQSTTETQQEPIIPSIKVQSLERRMDGKNSLNAWTKQEEMLTTPPPSPSKSNHNTKPPSILERSVQQKRSRRVALQQLPSSPSSELVPTPSPPRAKEGINTQAARLYAFLIERRYVRSLYTELQTVLGLLFRSDCGVCHGQSASTCTVPSAFCWRSNALRFASMVLHALHRSVLCHVGSDLLRLITTSLESLDQKESEPLFQDLIQALRKHMDAREALRLQESTRVGCTLPVEVEISSLSSDFALPFDHQVDSRLHYRTPADAQLFSNREKVRDAFLQLLRDFQRQQKTIEGVDVSSTASAVTQLLRDVVMPANRWWFAKFFTMELIQVGSNPFVDDREVAQQIKGTNSNRQQAERNADRLRKLQRRLSTNHNNKGTTAPVHQTKKPAPQRTTKPKQSQSAPPSSDAILERLRVFFSEPQLFFFHFLYHGDSFEFSQLVRTQLIAEFQQRDEAFHAQDEEETRRTFTDVVLKLRVIAKFLGLLDFLPQYHFSLSVVTTSNEAMVAAKQQAIRVFERKPTSLNLVQCLQQSILKGRLVQCIPWLSEYLVMMASDCLTIETLASERADQCTRP